jgi:hypothetical protein
MRCGRWLLGVLALAMFVMPAAAERIPSQRTVGQKSTGTRIDITVPYLTNGTNAFRGSPWMPYIYSSQEVDVTTSMRGNQVFNLIFYGSRQSFGDRSNGAIVRPGNQLRPPKSQ